MDSDDKARKEHHPSDGEGDTRPRPSKNLPEEERKVNSRPNYGHRGRHSVGHGRNYFGPPQNEDRRHGDYHHRNRYDERGGGKNYPRKRSHSRDRNRDNRNSSYRRHSPDRKRGNGYGGERSSGSQRDRTHTQSYSKGQSKRDNKASPPDTTTEQKSSGEELDEDLRPISLNISCPAASTLVKQIEQRKLLFSKKETPEATASTSSVWQQTKFTDDSDGKMSAKFKRLMGMKDGGEGAGGGTERGTKRDDRPPGAQSKDFFSNLEKQYEVARTITHTQRGVGLGFGSTSTTLLSRPSMNPTGKNH